MMKRSVTLILLSLVCGIEAGAQSALEVLLFVRFYHP